MLQYIFCLAPFFVCVFWADLLFRTKTKGGHPKKILGIFMTVSAVFYFSLSVYHLADNIVFRYFDELFILSSLLIFPTCYLYMVGLTKESIHQKKYIWHIVPAFIFVILYIVFNLRLDDKEYQAYILNYLHSDSISIYQNLSLNNNTDQLAFIFILSRTFYLTQIVIYITLGLKLSKSWKSRLKESLSETGGRDIRVVEVISGVAIFLAIVGFFVDYFGRFFAPKDSLILLTPAFIFSGIYFKIGQTGYEQDFTISELEEVEKTAELIDNNTTVPNPSKIRQELEILMVEKKIYLTPDIRITTLCEELRTNRTYLSQVLNDELKENFNSYINKYRVKYAIELLKDKKWDKYSLDKFAELSGFGSTISMIRAFKQLTGKTPREFRV